MRILIVGGGGREHALAWKTSQSPRVTQVCVAPGNAGTALETNIENIDIGSEDIPALLRFAQQTQIELTIVGPEAPLAAGIVDVFKDAGLRCFGPSRIAAQLEASKTFCKDFLIRHKIPTAEHETFTDREQASEYIKGKGVPIVIKADGLAAGKGVTVAHDGQTAFNAAKEMLEGGAFGDAGRRIIVEEFLQGEEASFIVIADGKNALPLATSQDHKPRDNGDKGPNTGGMGAYSPAPAVTPDLHSRIMREIIQPTLSGMAAEGMPYTGFLYAGIMIDKHGNPRVLEFNCRLGDPETQPIMMRLRSDLVDLCEAAIDRRIDGQTVEWDSRAALGVVLAAGGYPGNYESGEVISGLTANQQDNCKVFHAGTRLRNGDVITAGGRVLCACAMGNDVLKAQAKAYSSIGNIHWKDVYYRTDIGYRATKTSL